MKRWFTTSLPFNRVTESYGVAVVLSLLLHLLMLALLMINWNNDATIKRLPPVPISAALVPLPESSSAAVEKQQAAQAQRQAEARREAEARKRAEAKKQAEVKKRLEEERQKALALKQAEEKKRQQLVREQEEARRRQKEQERLQREQRRREQEALEQAIALEQQEIENAQQLAGDQLEQARYAALIQSLTSQYWNRPPSARNNMMTEIRISLSPTGDVLEISMVKSSGSDEFDRSVIQAIRRAAPFSELKNLERRIFDQYFRRITFRFRPEDLVR